MQAITAESVRWHVLRNQFLSDDVSCSDILGAAAQICGLHSTAPTTPYLSLWARLAAFDPDSLDRILHVDRTLLRITCMRSTLFAVPATQLCEYYGATRTLQRRSARHMAQLLALAGVSNHGDGSTLEKLTTDIAGEIRDRGPLTVAELTSSLPLLSAKVRYAPDKPYSGTFSLGSQLVPWLCSEGVLVRARPRGSWRSNLYEYALLDDWLAEAELGVPAPRVARRKLIARYIHNYGPVRVDDIVWWSGFSRRHVDQALSSLGSVLTEVVVENVHDLMIMSKEQAATLQSLRVQPRLGVCLLPALDPLVMGYRNRSLFLPARRSRQVFDRSGNAFATAWSEGQIVGVWEETVGGLCLWLWDMSAADDLVALAGQLALLLRQCDGLDRASAASPDIDCQPYPNGMSVRNPFSLHRLG